MKPRKRYTPEFKTQALDHAARLAAAQRPDEETDRVIETIFRTHCRRYGYRRIGA
jgi:Flp pilus assembly protein TadG